MAEIKIAADSGGGSVSLKGPATTTGNAALTYTLPDATTGGVLRTTTTPGGLLQVLSSTKTDTFLYNGTQSIDDITGTDQAGSGSVWCVKITPSSSSNKILVLGSISVGSLYYTTVVLYRDSTALNIGDAASSRTRGTFGVGYLQTGDIPTYNIPYLDSPSSTSELTYKFKIGAPYHATYLSYVNRDYTDGDGSWTTRAASVITVMEIAA
tara:strand:- start:765 stop:1394 length:630 start_codon:yes stop_codon:yes gene_type:complete